MKILLHTIGSFGDLHPVIGLARALKHAGHETLLATSPFYRNKIDQENIPFHAIHPDHDFSDHALAERSMHPTNGPRTVISEIVDASIKKGWQDLQPIADWPDLIITGPLSFAAVMLAKKHQIPWISTVLTPMSMFSQYDPSIAPNAPWLFPLQKHWGAIGHKIYMGLVRSVVNQWLCETRKLRAELQISDYADPILGGQFSPLGTLVMFSKLFAAPQLDWPKNSIQTGFIFNDKDGDIELDHEIEAFMNGGAPPIIFTLGSAAVMRAGDFFRIAALSAAQVGRRALLVYGKEQQKNIADITKSRDILATPYAPYSKIFSRSCINVHQGGVGTCAQALLSGVPSVVVPFSHDQPDNAARMHRLGVANQVRLGNLSKDTLSNALESILNDTNFTGRAQSLSEKLKSENGATAAVEAIEKLHAQSK